MIKTGLGKMIYRIVNCITVPWFVTHETRLLVQVFREAGHLWL